MPKRVVAAASDAELPPPIFNVEPIVPVPTSTIAVASTTAAFARRALRSQLPMQRADRSPSSYQPSPASPSREIPKPPYLLMVHR